MEHISAFKTWKLEDMTKKHTKRKANENNLNTDIFQTKFKGGQT